MNINQLSIWGIDARFQVRLAVDFDRRAMKTD
jgi:hypothetical protein